MARMAKRHADFLVLAFDVGTSSTRTALFDNHGRRLPDTSAAVRYSVAYGNDGRAELSPSILLRAVTRARNRTLRAYRSVAAARRVPVLGSGASAFWYGLLGVDLEIQAVT